MGLTTNRRLGITLLLIFLFVSALLFAKATPKVKKVVIPPTKLEKNEAFYDSLKAKADRNWLLKSIYPAVFSVDSIEVTIHADDKTFERWKGKTIRHINVDCLDVFPPDSTDSRKNVIILVKKAGNGVHLKTREWVIRDNLLFQEGDKLSAKILRRNIAYLRSFNYLSEVQFFIISTKKNSDSVDVLVVVRDKFSINLKGQYVSKSKFRLLIDDRNFLGLGNQIKNEIRVDSKSQKPIGWESYYSIPNIRRTFIKGELGYSDLTGYNRKSAALSRPFLFPVLHAAGGADITETYVHAPVDTTATDRIVLGGWSGYCVKGSPGPANQYIYAALALQQTWFKKRPEVGLTYGKLWHESLLILSSLAVTQSEYKRLPYMNSFLENEDIPVGFMHEYLFGQEFGEFRNRQFLGLRGARGVALENSSFLYLKGGIESFIYKTNLEQGVIVFEPLYITPVRKIGRFHTRTFIRQRIILGFKRFPGETLNLSTDPYFRGYRNLYGRNLIAMGAEKDFVAPWDVIGFSIAFFGFIDGVMVADSRTAPDNDDLLFTEGIGIRLRNPYMIWKSIEMRIAFNQSNGHKNSFGFTLVAKVPLKMTDFEGRKPEPYQFK